MERGERVGAFEVLGPLGAGGMGEVYRARDTRLGRDVALKCLPASLAEDPGRLARLTKEAQILASLNHPHIATLFGLEESNGTLVLVMELVEGQTLHGLLHRGPLQIHAALNTARQIAEGLEAAHEKGILHRDLKPSNIAIDTSGRVKLLDFGLARAVSLDHPPDPQASTRTSPGRGPTTMTGTGTPAGVILGTAAYMSPEQVSGTSVDKRADIWSFGVVLFKMLTGASPFSGETAPEVMASILKEEPAWDRLPPGCPPAIARLIRRCLRKAPRERLQHIGDARLEIQDILVGTEAVSPPVDVDEVRRTERRRRSRERWGWATAFVVVAGLASLFAYRQLTRIPESRPPAHFILQTPDDLAFSEFIPLALSPDGRHLAFVATSPGGKRELWMRSLDSPEARPLPGTEGADSPFWSADSGELAFVAGGELRKLVLAGGTVQRLCPVPQDFDGGTWSSGGTIVFSEGGRGARLYSVSDAGGEAKPLTRLDESKDEIGHWRPQFLPDGRHLLFLVSSSKQRDSGTFVTSLEAPGEKRRLRSGEPPLRYAAPGALLFVQDGILLAQRFDVRKLVTMGEPIPIASSVAAWSPNPTWGWFSVSNTGRLAWLSGPSSDSRLEWIDRGGRCLATLGEPGEYGQIALSPDGKRVVAEIADEGQYDLWVIDVARGAPSRLTTDPANDRDPVWSPDSQQIIYSSNASGDQNLLRKGLLEPEAAAPLPGGIGQTLGADDIAKDWIREDNTLLYLTAAVDQTLWKVSLARKGPPEKLVKGFLVDNPRVSPDGRWLAYISQQSGDYEVYVEPFGRRGKRVRVSTGGGGQPRWRGDGKELFYLSEGALMAVTVREGGDSVEVGLPTTLVPAKDLRAVVEGPDYSDYSVTPNGQRFLVKRPAEGREKPRIHVLLDWPSLLAR